jgi:hypothetical protein
MVSRCYRHSSDARRLRHRGGTLSHVGSIVPICLSLSPDGEQLDSSTPGRCDRARHTGRWIVLRLFSVLSVCDGVTRQCSSICPTLSSSQAVTTHRYPTLERGLPY